MATLCNRTAVDVSLLTAILTATMFAIFGFPFRYYQCWFSWGPGMTITGIAMYFFLAGAGGGFLGWGVATISRAQPTPNQLLNGVLYGLGGALALRADFGARPKRLPTDHLGGAKSILTASINWTAESLDEITRRRADARLRSLDQDLVIFEAYRIYADVANQPPRKLTDKAKTEILKKLVETMEELAESPKKDKQMQARALLIDFCGRYYGSEHFPKPLLSKPSSTRRRRNAAKPDEQGAHQAAGGEVQS